MGCRSRQRGEAAVKEIINTSGNSKVFLASAKCFEHLFNFQLSKVEMVELDLLSLASVRRFDFRFFCLVSECECECQWVNAIRSFQLA